jgi:hypothetical protein
MLRYHYTSRGLPMWFSAPADGASGGAPAGSDGGKGGDGKGDESFIDAKLFETLPWDELDQETQATLKKIQGGVVATLQQTKTLQSERERLDKLARANQSRADRLEADAKKKSKPSEHDEPPSDPYLAAVKDELIKAQFPPEQAEALAPVFAGMFKKVGTIERAQLGKDLTPMANQVLAGQAQTAFLQAQQQDELGMFQSPEVQQIVWDLVRERVANGVDTTPDVVLNLAKMAWADQQLAEKKGGKLEVPSDENRGRTTVLPATPPNMNTGGFFGGAPGAIRPIAQQQQDPNAAKTTLNEDTKNALAASFSTMLAGSKIRPKELAPFMDRRRK